MPSLGLDLPDLDGDGHNVTDWALQQFQAGYGPDITKEEVYEYAYGVMHAPDWRQRYLHDLQRNLPRIPLANDFEAFRSAGREMMNLHIGYETVDEWPVKCEVDGQHDMGAADDDAYRIEARMRWGKNPDRCEDRTVLIVNSRCRLVGIPAEAEDYKVSGRSPLQWAIDSLRMKHDTKSGIVDDPNGWHEWADKPFNLIRHLRRLVHVSVETARIVASLPPSLTASSTTDTDAGDQ